jgi:hypothetical protein
LAEKVITSLYCLAKRKDIVASVGFEIQDRGSSHSPLGASLYLCAKSYASHKKPRPGDNWTLEDRAVVPQLYRGEYAYRLLDGDDQPPGCASLATSLNLVTQNGPITCRLSTSSCRATIPCTSAGPST